MRQILLAAAVAMLALGGCKKTPAGGSGETPAAPAAVTTPAAAPNTAAPAAVTATAAATPSVSPPMDVGALRIDPGSISFGVVAPQSKHTASITLRNRGDLPITIVEAKPSCMCTAPENLAGKVIPPGGALPFSTDFVARTEPGSKSAKVFMTFDYGGQKKQAIISLDAEIVMAIQADPPYVDALKVNRGQFAVASNDGRPFRILTADGKPPVYADGFDPASDTPRSTYRLAWEVEQRSESNCEGMRLWWPIETDHPECAVLPVRVRHACTGGRADPGRRQRGWFFDEPIACIGAAKAGRAVEAEVVLANPTKVRVRSVRSLSADATAELIEAKDYPDGKTKCTVRFTPRLGYRGLLYALVEVVSDRGAKDTAFVASVRE